MSVSQDSIPPEAEFDKSGISKDGDALSGSALTPPPELFDPVKLRIAPDYLAQGAVKKLLTHIPIRKPNPQRFIRVHPDKNYRITSALIELKEERETYLVTPEYFAELEEDLQTIFTLYLTIDRANILSLWPIRMPGSDGRVNSWHSTAHDAAERAMQVWLRVVPSQSLGGYQQHAPEIRYPEPEWPTLPFSKILEIAFKGRLVTGPDHPVMQRLRGAI
jgi:hypothetical protein